MESWVSVSTPCGRVYALFQIGVGDHNGIHEIHIKQRT